MGKKKKMTKTLFAAKRGMVVSTFSRALKGERNLCSDNAEKVARALGTGKVVWRFTGFTSTRIAAWLAYVAKCNGGGE